MAGFGCVDVRQLFRKPRLFHANKKRVGTLLWLPNCGDFSRITCMYATFKVCKVGLLNVCRWMQVNTFVGPVRKHLTLNESTVVSWVSVKFDSFKNGQNHCYLNTNAYTEYTSHYPKNYYNTISHNAICFFLCTMRRTMSLNFNCR